MPAERTPRVSIITPAYNAERYIEQCMRSALAQTCEEWEQIVVDDGSTDATAEIVRSFDDPRIRYLALPHRGLGALAETYNTALGVARGDVIGILEGDDVWPPHKLARQLPAFDEPDVMLSWGRALVIDETDRVVRRWLVPRTGRRDRTLPELFRLLARWNVLPALTVMVRRSALTAIGGFRQTGASLLVDLPTWLLISGMVPGRARYIDEVLGLYRLHTTNTGVLHIAAMRLEHEQIVQAVLREIGTDRLAQLGWNARAARVANASARLTQGIAYLHDGRRVPARAAFAATLRDTTSPREYVTALAGYGSAVLGINMIERVQKLRLAAAALTLRLGDRGTGRLGD